MTTPTESKNWTPSQLRFIAWLALPKAQRRPKLQREIALEIGVGEDSLSDWKKLPGFMDAVNILARDLVKHDIADILGVIRREAKRANLPYVNMALAMAGMTTDIENAGKGPSGDSTARERFLLAALATQRDPSADTGSTSGAE